MVDSVSDSLRPVKRGLCDCGYFFLFFVGRGVTKNYTASASHLPPPCRMLSGRTLSGRTPHAARRTLSGRTLSGYRGGLARWWACALVGLRAGGLARCQATVVGLRAVM